MIEYPPLPVGSEAQQLLALREYLVRLARRLDALEQGLRSLEENAGGTT